MTAARNLAGFASGSSLGAAVSGTAVSDSKGNVRTITVINPSSPYTLIASDAGKTVSLVGAVTIPSSIFSAGEVVTFYNNSASSITITCSAVTTYKAGVNSTITSATLLPRGLATVLFYSSTAAVISGNI